jgi:hypothetical protein
VERVSDSDYFGRAVAVPDAPFASVLDRAFIRLSATISEKDFVETAILDEEFG